MTVTMRSLVHSVGARWSYLSNGSTNRRIFKAAIIVGGATAIVSLASIARELLIAATFGTSGALDAYLIALSLPTFFINIIGGSFGSALIPSFVRVRDLEGQAIAQRVFSSAMSLGIGLLCVTSAFLALIVPYVVPVIASGFDAKKLQLTQQLCYILLPIIAIGGLAMMWSSVLNAGERFALAAFTPALVPLFGASALIAARNWGVFALAFGTIGGFCLQLCLQGRGLLKQGISLRPTWLEADPTIRHIIRQYLHMVAAGALLSGMLLIDQAVAATLGPGSVATFTYGTKVVTLVLALGAGAIGTALLPYFSKMVAVSDWNQIRQTMRVYSKFSLIFTIPLACALYLLSEPVVRFSFQRGAFTEADTLLVARVQSVYALQIPFYVLVILCIRLLSSLGANHVLSWSAIISFPVNASLDLILSRVFGVAGIALSSTLMFALMLAFLWIMVHRALRNATSRDVTLVSMGPNNDTSTLIELTPGAQYVMSEPSKRSPVT